MEHFDPATLGHHHVGRHHVAGVCLLEGSERIGHQGGGRAVVRAALHGLEGAVLVQQGHKVVGGVVGRGTLLLVEVERHDGGVDGVALLFGGASYGKQAYSHAGRHGHGNGDAQRASEQCHSLAAVTGVKRCAHSSTSPNITL